MHSDLIPPHPYEVFEGATGRVCTAMVIRQGVGDSCGLPVNDPIHIKENK